MIDFILNIMTISLLMYKIKELVKKYQSSTLPFCCEPSCDDLIYPIIFQQKILIIISK